MDIQQNKQMVMMGYRLFQSGDIRALMDLYHDDAEMAGPESEFVPFAGQFHGKAGIGQFFAQLDATVEAVRFEPKQFIAEGDKVVVIGEASWRTRQSGRPYDNSWVHVFTIRDGKVARFDSYYDTAPTARALHGGQPVQSASSQQLRH
jgi:ketosteroid isomerase-like protein